MTGGATPFESATELRGAHESLLLQIDKQLELDPSEKSELAALARMEPDISEFLSRGAETGMFLEQIKDRTSCQVLLDYWVSALARIGYGVASSRLARFDRSRLPDLTDKPCPYVGLEAFRNKTFFFGRAEDTKNLIEQVRRHPLTIVLGASGSGKSSLVMGGLLPAIKRGNDGARWWRLRPFTPGDDVTGNATRAFASLLGRAHGPSGAGAPGLADQPEQFARAIAAAAPFPLVVTIDQFEEVFTLSTDAERNALAQCLGTLLSAERGHRVILTMREEFRSRIVGLVPLEPYVGRAWYSVPPMGYADLREAIERPAAMVNLELQSGIADELAKKVLGQPAALPLLQFALQRLWFARDRNRITREVYERVGSPLDALKKTADDFYEGLAPQTRDELKRVLLELVRVDELLEAYRQPVRTSSLLRAGKANTREVLKRLAEMDYVRITDRAAGADQVVEIKHESLIRNWPLLVGWIDEKRFERRRRLALEEAARRWADNRRPDEGLLTGWQVEGARVWTDLSSLETEFVDASAGAIDSAQMARERAQKKRNFLVIGGALVVIFISIGAVYWYRTITEEVIASTALLAKKQKELNDALARDLADISAKYADISAKKADVFVRDLKLPAQTPAKSEAITPVRIFVHIASEAQRAQAQDIAEKLRANRIEVPKGIQLVQKFPEKTEVRYFHQSDKAGALELVRSLKTSLGVDDTEAKLIPGLEKTVPARQYELWFAPSAFPQESKLANADERQRQSSQAAAQRATADKAAADKTAVDKATADKATADKATADKAAADKAAADKAAADKAVADKAATDKEATDRAAAERRRGTSTRIGEPQLLKRRSYVELLPVFDNKPLWVFVNNSVGPGERPRVIVFDKQPTVENIGSDAHVFRAAMPRGTNRLFDDDVGPEEFDVGFAYGRNKYRLAGKIIIRQGIEFEVRRE